MNSLDFPQFLDMDYCDSPWLTKDIDITSVDCLDNTNNDIFFDCNDDMKYERITSDAMTIPQNQKFSTKEKELWEYPSSLDTDINFYDHHYTDKKCTFLSNIDDETDSPVSLWGTPMDLDSLKREEIFQVEEDEANPGPTLAQLNSNVSLNSNEPTFDIMNFSDTNFEELKLSSNDGFIIKSRTESITDLVQNTSQTKVPVNTNEIFPETTNIKVENKEVFSASSLSSSYSGISRFGSTTTKTCSSPPVTVDTFSTIRNFSGVTKLQQLLDGNLNPKKESYGLLTSGVSTSAPTERVLSDLSAGLQISKETSIRQRNNSSTDRSLCSFSSLSLSNDESFDSSRDEFGFDDDGSSDADSGDAANKYTFSSWFPSMESKQKISENKKNKRYFWQYNIQSKGPKGPKMSLETSIPVDPHILSNASDPVFSTQCQLDGVKHSGKARRGDGNDLTPNPQKLYSIGLELKKLGKVISDLEPTIDQPFNIRPKSRREKNKLASRVCRLKKKAQHEANKLKLYGLQKEHYNLLSLMDEIKQLISMRVVKGAEINLTQSFEKLLSCYENVKVAGCTTEFVNHILEKVSGGDPNGGLSEFY